MKFITVLVGIVGLVSAVNQETLKISEGILAALREVGNSCALENNVDPEMVYQIIDGTLPKDETASKYLFCFSQKFGLIEADGHMIVDKFIKLIGNHHVVEEFGEALRKCNKITKANPIATVVAMQQCFVDTSPIRFLL